jgi:hypothetical protein
MNTALPGLTATSPLISPFDHGIRWHETPRIDPSAHVAAHPCTVCRHRQHGSQSVAHTRTIPQHHPSGQATPHRASPNAYFATPHRARANAYLTPGELAGGMRSTSKPGTRERISPRDFRLRQAGRCRPPPLEQRDSPDEHRG